jgi:hypothetical protein
MTLAFVAMRHFGPFLGCDEPPLSWKNAGIGSFAKERLDYMPDVDETHLELKVCQGWEPITRELALRLAPNSIIRCPICRGRVRTAEHAGSNVTAHFEHVVHHRMISMAIRIPRQSNESFRVARCGTGYSKKCLASDLFVLFGWAARLLLGRVVDLVDGHELARCQGHCCYKILADPTQVFDFIARFCRIRSDEVYRRGSVRDGDEVGPCLRVTSIPARSN